MAIYKKQSGIWKDTGAPFIKSGGVWKPNSPYVRTGGVWKPLIQPLAEDLIFWMPTYVYTEGTDTNRVSNTTSAYDNVSGSSMLLRNHGGYENGTNNELETQHMPSTFLNHSFGSKISFSIWHRISTNNYYTGKSEMHQWGLLRNSSLYNVAYTHRPPIQSTWATDGDSYIVSYWYYGTNLNRVTNTYSAEWLPISTSWKLLTITCDFDTQTFNTYLNQNLIDSSTSTSYGSGVFGKFESTNTGFMFYQGNGYDNEYKRNWYVKHFKIWDKLLSDSDVVDLYNLGQNPSI